MLKFETAQDRLLQKKKVNMLIMGEAGVGKTYSARSLNPETTLFIDCEAGTLSLEKSKDQPAWNGTTLNMRRQAQQLGIHPWELCRAIACMLAGPEPSAKDGPYARTMYDTYVRMIGGGDAGYFDRFDTIFVDSITVASRWAFDWACQQPECVSQKTGKLDKLNAYGLLGQEVVTWATQLQHQPKNIIMSCILEDEVDEFKRKSFKPQIEGRASGLKLPGIFDLVMTLSWIEFLDGQGAVTKTRAFVTQEGNDKGVPAKDRSGLLEPYEKPDLGYIINKIQNFNVQQAVAA